MSEINTDSQGAPDVIWLQLHGDADPEIEGPADYQSPGVTWCWEQIYNQDVQYIRADIVQAALAALILDQPQEGKS